MKLLNLFIFMGLIFINFTNYSSETAQATILSDDDIDCIIKKLEPFFNEYEASLEPQLKELSKGFRKLIREQEPLDKLDKYFFENMEMVQQIRANQIENEVLPKFFVQLTITAKIIAKIIEEIMVKVKIILKAKTDQFLKQINLIEFFIKDREMEIFNISENPILNEVIITDLIGYSENLNEQCEKFLETCKRKEKEELQLVGSVAEVFLKLAEKIKTKLIMRLENHINQYSLSESEKSSIKCIYKDLLQAESTKFFKKAKLYKDLLKIAAIKDGNINDIPPALKEACKNSLRRCKNCGKIETKKNLFKKCGRCKSTVTCYCSTDCQKAQWKFHKQFCQPKENRKTEPIPASSAAAAAAEPVEQEIIKDAHKPDAGDSKNSHSEKGTASRIEELD